MSLVRIDDAETNRIVQNFAGEKKLHKYWIDANDKNKENEFVHVDGSKVIYTNWNKTQPNNKNNNENCVSSGLGGYWFDINCDNKISSICYKILASENDEKFYTLPGQVNFETAVKMCKEKGMSLVRIDDTETNKIVLKYAMKNKLDIYWIDANDQKKENEFEHIDQTRVIYTNWDKNQPDNLGKNENCVVTGVIREGFWHDANCNKEKIGICNDDQFYVLPQLVNFETAMIKCKERGMSLVRIDDSETNKIMHKYANEKNLNKHWIDASRNKEKEFVHIDGSKIIYVNWDRSEPSDTEGHKNCVYTGKKHEGFWHNFNCQNDIFGICNVTKVSSNDNQFYTITGLTNFETAVEICDEKGMSLVRIDNADTNKIVYDYAARKSLGRYWVDLNDRDKENLFVHSDGSKVNYINWSPNEPSNSDNKEHCVHSGVELKGLWNDINCDIPLVAICNTTKVPSNDRQFYVLPRQVNFETAVKMCEEKGMSLIRIDDSTTNKIVYEYAVGKRLSKHWIDANRNKRKEFVHIDGSKVIYTNWDKNEPSDAGGHKNCVYTSTEREGFWHDFNCQNDIFAICNVTKEKSQNANQFYVLPHLVNLKKAVKMCMEKGMSLVKIDDAVTNKILHKFALKKNLNIYWIDGYRKNKKNFVHLDNSDLTYTNWFFNEPNNFEGHENCIVGELNYGGFWNDFKCTQLIFGICNATTPTLKDNPSHILPKTFNHSSILRLCKEKGRKLVKLNHADLNDLSFLDILSLTKINLNSFKALVELVDYDENLFIFNQNDPHGPVNDKGDENISEVLRLNNDLLKYLKLDADVYVICYGDE